MATSTKPDTSHHPFARAFRVMITGTLFGTLIGVMVPVSPLFRRTFQNDKMGHRLVLHAMTVSGLSSAAVYARYIDWGTSDPSWGPWMTPLHGPVCSLAAFLACSLTYPGLYVLVNESTAKIALYEYVRLTLKVLVAFHRVHIPGAIAVGAFLGLLMFPLNRRPRRWRPPQPVAEETAAAPPERALQ